MVAADSNDCLPFLIIKLALEINWQWSNCATTANNGQKGHISYCVCPIQWHYNHSHWTLHVCGDKLNKWSFWRKATLHAVLLLRTEWCLLLQTLRQKLPMLLDNPKIITSHGVSWLESALQTTARSVQPFFHSSHTQTQTDMQTTLHVNL